MSSVCQFWGNSWPILRTDESVLVVDAHFLEFSLVGAVTSVSVSVQCDVDLRIVDLLEDILEPSIILLQDSADISHRPHSPNDPAFG